jgi:hypothetical protein
MTPTPKLRFVVREVYISQPQTPNVAEKTAVQILQQWWIPENADRTQAHYKGEWRDVPTEKEQA